MKQRSEGTLGFLVSRFLCLIRENPCSSVADHISCRIAHKSWKTGLNNDSFRNGTPGDPPVPFFAPIVRSTNLMCRYRHSCNPSSKSVINSKRMESSGELL